MNKDNSKPDINRRTFLAASPLLAFGAAVAAASDDKQQAVQQRPALSVELSAAEAEVVAKSKMARDVPDFFGKGHNCAESGLSVALRFLDKPPELEWIASGFGGGVQHGDLCGFLTSGVMAFGLHAGTLKLDASAAKAACSQHVRDTGSGGRRWRPFGAPRSRLAARTRGSACGSASWPLRRSRN